MLLAAPDLAYMACAMRGSLAFSPPPELRQLLLLLLILLLRLLLSPALRRSIGFIASVPVSVMASATAAAAMPSLRRTLARERGAAAAPDVARARLCSSSSIRAYSRAISAFFAAQLW
tara:strand:- start:60 stop:413 length:354 start_codon:yes stop_codon:yes gene_type:complete